MTELSTHRSIVSFIIKSSSKWKWLNTCVCHSKGFLIMQHRPVLTIKDSRSGQDMTFYSVVHFLHSLAWLVENVSVPSSFFIFTHFLSRQKRDEGDITNFAVMRRVKHDLWGYFVAVASFGCDIRARNAHFSSSRPSSSSRILSIHAFLFFTRNKVRDGEQQPRSSGRHDRLALGQHQTTFYSALLSVDPHDCNFMMKTWLFCVIQNSVHWRPTTSQLAAQKGENLSTFFLAQSKWRWRNLLFFSWNSRQLLSKATRRNYMKSFQWNQIKWIRFRFWWISLVSR